MLDRYALRYFDRRVKLVDLAPLHVAGFVRWLAEPEEHDGRRLADKTIRNIVGALRACLATARREGLIRHNPADDVQLPKRPLVEDDDERDARALTRQQLGVVLDLVHPRHRLLSRFLAATGLRISEAIALEWRHLELESNKQPHVKVRQRVRNGRIGPPKSRHSRRDVPLPASLAQALWSHKGAPDAPVFPSSTGTPLHKDNLRNRVLKPAVEEAGVPWAGLHTFRHTFVSLHIDRGTNVVQLAKLLGHHSPTITLDTYAHLLDAGVGEALDVDAAIRQGCRSAKHSAVACAPEAHTEHDARELRITQVSTDGPQDRILFDRP